MTVRLARRHFLAGVAAATGWAHSARAADPKVLIGLLDEDPPIINPGISSAISSYVAGAPVYSSLAWADLAGNLHPDLADSWETSADGKEFTFHLKSGVVWHDGKPFTAADAQWSLSELTAKIHPSAKGAYRALDRIDAPDDHTLIIRMKYPVAAFMNVPTAIGPILPRHLWEGTDLARNPHNKMPVGTGPYKLVSIQEGDRINYVRNENYHLKGLPGFDEFVLRIIPDATSRVAAYEKGEVDIMFNTAVPATEIPRLMRVPGTTTHTAPLPGSSWIANVNTRSEPYGDVRVRQAMMHAINRKFIRETVLPGISEPMLGPLPPGSPLYSHSLVDYEFDPVRSNAMLDEAGYKRGADGTRFGFRFLFVGSDIRIVKMGDIISQNLAAVGIKTSLRPLDRAALNQIGYIGGQFDMIIDSFALGPDPDIGVERLYNSSNIRPQPFVNNSGYSNSELDALFDKQRTQTAFADRKATYEKIQEILWRDVPVMPICAYSGPVIVHSSYVADAFVQWNTTGEDLAHARPVA
jgi:peptide/nickel transport system substrate-binding protein